MASGLCIPDPVQYSVLWMWYNGWCGACSVRRRQGRGSLLFNFFVDLNKQLIILLFLINVHFLYQFKYAIYLCHNKKFSLKIEILKFIIWCYLIIYNSLYIYHLKELLNKYYGHIMYLCVYSSSTREKFRDCWRKPEVSIPVFQLMKGKFESVSSTIFHVMQRICFSFVQNLMNKSHSMSVETFKN